MKERDSFRGTSIDETFAESFKKTRFYRDIYYENKNDIIIGVRDSFINLYYNCDSIALIDVDKPGQCKIDSYYTNGEKKVLDENQYVSYFDIIKENSNKRNKQEKQAQQRLFIDNNNNPSSNWFCIDVEYTKSLQGKEHAEDWRFDIIAISKESPFRVALIELKYGSGALKEPSGIRTHVKDFYSFYKDNKFEILIKEIVTIINKLSLLGVDIPNCLKSVSCEDIAPEPEFYFITLNNNSIPPSENTPKKTMSGYLFNDKRWGAKRISSLVKDKGDYYDLIENSKTFKPVFLFSKATLPNLQIDDILDPKYYDVEIIKK
jgi:hypothetical protein